jgi:hypothetical protein
MIDTLSSARADVTVPTAPAAMKVVKAIECSSVRDGDMEVPRSFPAHPCFALAI